MIHLSCFAVTWHTPPMLFHCWDGTSVTQTGRRAGISLWGALVPWKVGEDLKGWGPRELHRFPCFIPQRAKCARDVLAGSSTAADLCPLQTKK